MAFATTPFLAPLKNSEGAHRLCHRRHQGIVLPELRLED